MCFCVELLDQHSCSKTSGGWRKIISLLRTYDPICCMTIAFAVRSFPNLCIRLIMFFVMTFLTLLLLDGVNLPDYSVAFAHAPRPDSRYVWEDEIIMSYDYISADTSLFALACDDFFLTCVQ